MRKVISIVLIMGLMAGFLPKYSHAAGSPEIKLTIMVKDSTPISSQLLSKIEKDHATVVKTYQEIGAIMVKGSADIIPLLQKETEIQSVSPVMIQSLPKELTIPLDKSNMMPILKPGPEPPPIEETYPELYQAYQWDIKRVNNYGESYKFEKGNHDVVVGIIDSGVNQNHPDLNANVLGGKNFVPTGGFSGKDLTETGEPTDFNDRAGHGTHVAGAIAGNGLVMGVAPNIGVKAYRVFDQKGNTTTQAVADAIISATKEGVNVINLSLGGYSVLGQISFTDPNTGKTYKLGNEVADFLLYKRAVKYAVDHGVTVVTAAGNDNINLADKKEVTDFMNKKYGEQGFKFVGAGMEVPGTLPGVINVAATGPDDLKASYSNYGAGVIDLTAPGGELPHDDFYFDQEGCLSTYMDRYAFMIGTSMAAPKVSAVAALIIAHDRTLSPNQVKQKMINDAQELGKNSADKNFGKGMIQAPSNFKLSPYVEWQKSYGGLDLDYGYHVVQTKDGGYLGFGDTQSFGGSANELYLVKTGSDGRIEWRKVWDAAPVGPDLSVDIQPISDGNYLVLGKHETPIEGQENVFFTYMSEITEDGKVLWEKKIELPDGNFAANAFVETNDGYVLAGGFDDITVLKVSRTGEQLWKKVYTVNGGSINTLKATFDGGFILGGKYAADPIQQTDNLLIKLNKNGDKVWMKQFGKGELTRDQIADIEPTKDGGFILAGSQAFREWMGDAPIDVSDAYYAKVNAVGDIIWQKTIGGEKTNEQFDAVTATKDGNYALAGTNLRDGDSDIYVLKIDENGNKIYDRYAGGDLEEKARDIKETRDGGFIVIGYTRSYVSGISSANPFGAPGDKNLFLVKFK